MYKEFLEIVGDNCRFRHDKNMRGKSSPSNPSQNSFMQQSERNASKTRSPRGKSPSGGMSRWPCPRVVADLVKSALMRIARLKNSPAKGLKRKVDKSAVAGHRVIGTDDSVENYTDLFTIAFRNDDIQEFDSKWDGILLSMTKIPPDDILEGLYKLRIRESEKLRTVLELYDLETHQKLGLDYHRLKAMVKRSIEQEIRNKNFGTRSGNFEKNAVVKNQGTKQRVQRILGDCWQRESTGQCVKGDDCSFRHDVNKRGKSSPSNPSPNSFMQQSERKPSRTRSPRGESRSGRMS